MPLAPATMVRTKRSWPGYVDDREARAVGQLERRVAEVDRDPALVLLGEAIGVLARQRLDERRLAVIDVSRGADGQRHVATIGFSSDSTWNPAPSSSARHCCSSRSRPPARTSIRRSSHFAPVGIVAGLDHRLVDQKACVRRGDRSDRAQDPGRVGVGPVVEDPGQDVGVALRHRLEEAPYHELDAVAERRLVTHRLGQVEDDAAQLRAARDQLAEQRSVATADVDDDFAVAPLESRQTLGRPQALARHRKVERRPLGRVHGEPLPEIGPEPALERRLGQRSVQILGRLEKDAAEEVRELAPAGGEQEAGAPRCARTLRARPRGRCRRSRALAAAGGACPGRP